MPRDEVCLYSEEELEEVMKMTPKELLESGKWVILYDWQPSLKLYEDSQSSASATRTNEE